jgi:hypothetical protein
MRREPRTDGMHIFLGGLRPPNPPAGKGVEEPGPPIPLRMGCAPHTLPPGGGLGKPGFPGPLREGQALRRVGGWGKRPLLPGTV